MPWPPSKGHSESYNPTPIDFHFFSSFHSSTAAISSQNCNWEKLSVIMYSAAAWDPADVQVPSPEFQQRVEWCRAVLAILRLNHLSCQQDLSGDSADGSFLASYSIRCEFTCYRLIVSWRGYMQLKDLYFQRSSLPASSLIYGLNSYRYMVKKKTLRFLLAVPHNVKGVTSFINSPETRFRFIWNMMPNFRMQTFNIFGHIYPAGCSQRKTTSRH